MITAANVMARIDGIIGDDNPACAESMRLLGELRPEEAWEQCSNTTWQRWFLHSASIALRSLGKQELVNATWDLLDYGTTPPWRKPLWAEIEPLVSAIMEGA